MSSSNGLRGVSLSFSASASADGAEIEVSPERNSFQEHAVGADESLDCDYRDVIDRRRSSATSVTSWQHVKGSSFLTFVVSISSSPAFGS